MRSSAFCLRIASVFSMSFARACSTSLQHDNNISAAAQNTGLLRVLLFYLNDKIKQKSFLLN